MTTRSTATEVPRITPVTLPVYVAFLFGVLVFSENAHSYECTDTSSNETVTVIDAIDETAQLTVNRKLSYCRTECDPCNGLASELARMFNQYHGAAATENAQLRLLGRTPEEYRNDRNFMERVSGRLEELVSNQNEAISRIREVSVELGLCEITQCPAVKGSGVPRIRGVIPVELEWNIEAAHTNCPECTPIAQEITHLRMQISLAEQLEARASKKLDDQRGKSADKLLENEPGQDLQQLIDDQENLITRLEESLGNLRANLDRYRATLRQKEAELSACENEKCSLPEDQTSDTAGGGGQTALQARERTTVKCPECQDLADRLDRLREDNRILKQELALAGRKISENHQARQADGSLSDENRTFLELDLRHWRERQIKASRALKRNSADIIFLRYRLNQCEQQQCAADSASGSVRVAFGGARVDTSRTGASAQSTRLNGGSDQQRSRAAQVISNGFLEESVVQSDDSLTGTRFGIEIYKPLQGGSAAPFEHAFSGLMNILPGQPTTGERSLSFRASMVDADGSASAVRPTGELSAFIFIDESPVFEQGLLLGVDGQRASIDTELRQLELELGLVTPTVRDEHLNDKIRTAVGASVLFQSFELEHDIFQQDISFPEATVDTDLDVRDIFLAPKLAFNAASRTSGWNMVGQAHVAPGLLFSDGDATQQIDIPGNRDRIRLSDDHTKLALQAGIRGAVYKLVNNRVAIGITAGLQYQSANSAWRNPLLTTDQPARLGTASTTSLDLGAFLYVPMGPKLGP